MQRQLQETPPLVRRMRAAGEVLEIAPTHIMALFIVASCACAGLVVLWWTARPAHAPAQPPVGLVATPPATSGAPSAPASVPAPDRLVVHVSGAVASPGVRTMPGGARVDDAVRAAGGPTRAARTDQLNLARPLRDGEQIHVPNASEVAAGTAAGLDAGTSGGGAGPGQTDLINLNQATAAELDELPDIGPVLAERIIAFREDNGGFRSIEDLQQVSGIGEKTFAGLEDLVTV